MKQVENILVTGGTGFIGQHLIPDLLEQGHQIWVYGRSVDKIRQVFGQNVVAVSHLDDIHEPIHTIINLAGASIGESRWSERNKRIFLHSRVQTTLDVFNWAQQQKISPTRLINGSAIGFYGIDNRFEWQQVCDENSPPQDVFMSQLCVQWEEAANRFKALDMQVVKLRLGVVLGQGGGVLSQLINPIRYGKVGVIASGQQPLVWVHIDDVVAVVAYLLQQVSWQHDVYNVVAPQITTQSDFVQTACVVLQTRTLFSVPASLMRLAMGEQSDLVLNGQKVRPKHLLDESYDFQYGSLELALKNLLLN